VGFRARRAHIFSCANAVRRALVASQGAATTLGFLAHRPRDDRVPPTEFAAAKPPPATDFPYHRPSAAKACESLRKHPQKTQVRAALRNLEALHNRRTGLACCRRVLTALCSSSMRRGLIGWQRPTQGRRQKRNRESNASVMDVIVGALWPDSMGCATEGFLRAALDVQRAR
jgi:hypothetical protein